jgi:hypothetical protein
MSQVYKWIKPYAEGNKDYYKYVIILLMNLLYLKL